MNNYICMKCGSDELQSRLGLSIQVCSQCKTEQNRYVVEQVAKGKHTLPPKIFQEIEMTQKKNKLTYKKFISKFYTDYGFSWTIKTENFAKGFLLIDGLGISISRYYLKKDGYKFVISGEKGDTSVFESLMLIFAGLFSVLEVKNSKKNWFINIEIKY